MLDAKSPAHPVIIPTEPPAFEPEQRVFIGVVAPIDPRIETSEEIRDRILEATRYIPLEQLGTTGDCGFSPFSDDTSTSGETSFAKARARVEGTALAAEAIGDG
jgi:5-methyltetrahydropteroyltriglutamate--homocysteine methyltransferase